MMKVYPLPELRIIQIHYRDSTYAPEYQRCFDAFAKSGVYGAAGIPYEIMTPQFPEALRGPTQPLNLGIIGGEIAHSVAGGIRQRKAVLLVGGNCSHTTGVLGGLQDVYGGSARIGLVWLDAHGDFNTPYTTLSGMMGGMPVAVSAGLALPEWRENSHMKAPIPTDRIVLVDGRNLDPEEEKLIHATDVVIASPAPGFPGDNLENAVDSLANCVDMIYLHIDEDVLDARYVPNHGTVESDGPDMEQVLAVIDTVMATGKVVAFALASIYGKGTGANVSIQSAITLLNGGLDFWARYGMPDLL